MPKKDQDRGWADDPLVDLVSPHLRAAMELRGMGPTAVAKALGRRENPQTIHHLQLGDGRKRCRQSRRRALARVLRVPDTWLGGEPVEIPAPLGYRLAHEAASSPRVAITLAGLAESVVTSVVRDLERAETIPERPEAQLEPALEVVQGVLAALGDLVSMASWQRVVLVQSQPTGARSEGQLLQQLAAAPVVDPRREAAVLGLLEVWRALLDPWVAGDAALNYQGLLALWAAHKPSVAHWLPDNWVPPGLTAPSATSPYAMLVREPPRPRRPDSRPTKKRSVPVKKRRPARRRRS
jgi:hypothetical protein